MRVFLLILIFPLFVLAERNQICPVALDDYSDPEIWMEYKEKKVFFCCETCREDFNESPETYSVNLQLPVQAKLLAALQKSSVSGTTTTGQIPKIEKRQTVFNFLGRFHPVIVHFPIGLLVTALFAELLFIISKRHIFENSAFFMLVVGALGAVVAVALGFIAAKSFHTPSENVAEVLDSHMWQGCSAAVLAIITAFCKLMAAKKEKLFGSAGKWQLSYRVMLLFTVVILVMAGHLGGTLIYGEGFFSF